MTLNLRQSLVTSSCVSWLKPVCVNATLVGQMDAWLDTRREAKGQTIGALFSEEQGQCRPAPTPFAPEATTLATVTPRALIRLEGAVYSVWTRWVGLDVLVSVGATTVTIVGRDGMHVIHPRKRSGSGRSTTGITSRSYSTAQMTYDLRRLRLKGLIHRSPRRIATPPPATVSKSRSSTASSISASFGPSGTPCFPTPTTCRGPCAPPSTNSMPKSRNFTRRLLLPREKLASIVTLSHLESV